MLTHPPILAPHLLFHFAADIAGDDEDSTGGSAITEDSGKAGATRDGHVTWVCFIDSFVATQELDTCEGEHSPGWFPIGGGSLRSNDERWTGVERADAGGNA